MHKTLLTSFFYPPEHGGIQTYLHNLAQNLPPEKIAVLCKNQPNSATFDEQQKFQINRTSFDSKLKYIKLSNLTFYKTIKKTLQQENAKQLLLGHPLPLGISAIILKKRHNIPFSTFVHGKEIHETLHSGKNKNTLRKVLHEAKYVFATTEFMQNELVQNFKLTKEKVKIIPPGVTIPQKIKTKESNTANILTVARLVKRKGYHFTLNSLAKIHKKNQNVHYNIVGNGEELSNLKKQAKKLKIEEYITFHQEVSDKKLRELYSNANIFIMPSYNVSGDIEGFGIVYLEAASYGLPIIATNSGGISEAVEHNKTGILLPEPKNESDKDFEENLTQTLQGLISDPEKQKELGQAGLKRAQESFSWQTQSHKLIKHL